MELANGTAGITGTTARRMAPVSGQVHAHRRPPQGRPAIRPVTSANARAVSPDVVRDVDNGVVVWRVRCGDLIGRERCVNVFVDDGEVVISGPPGESARMSANQIGQLKAVLTEAARYAEG